MPKSKVNASGAHKRHKTLHVQHHALTLLKQNIPLSCKARDLQASERTIYVPKKDYAELLNVSTPNLKIGSKR